MREPKTESPLERANFFVNMNWNLTFKLKNPSAVIYTQTEKKFWKINRQYVTLYISFF